MSIGVSRGPEFESAIHLRHRRFISTVVQAAASFQKSLAAGQPAPTLSGGQDLAVFLGLCSVTNRTKAIKYISKYCQLSTEHDGEGLMAISAIAPSLLPCKFEKNVDFAEN